MKLPSHFLPRPPMPLDDATIAAFERLLSYATVQGQAPGRAECPAIDYQLTVPKWQFLSYLADTQPIVLHGSGNPDITTFEPRQSNDTDEFGNRQAVYAARDGLWPMYFAIVDRARYRMGLLNACVRVAEPSELAGSYYFFSIGGAQLPERPWRSGTVYLLPSSTFEQQQLDRWHGLDIESTQVASLVPVRPLARLAITPEDFPFLQQIRRHDPATIRQRALANPDGFPWLDT